MATQQPNQAVGAGINLPMNAWTGLPTYPAQSALPPVQQNPVRYTPNMEGLPAGLPPALAMAYGMQNAGPMPPSQAQLSGAQAGAAQGFLDPTWYVQNNPDVLAAWNTLKGKDDNWPMDKYGQWHYDTFGKNEGRVIGPNDPKLAQQQQPVQPAAQAAPAAGQTGMLSPEMLINLQNLLAGMQAARGG